MEEKEKLWYEFDYGVKFDVRDIVPQGNHNDWEVYEEDGEDVIYIIPQGNHNARERATKTGRDVRYIVP